MNKGLRSLSKWLSANKISLNITKTEVLIFKACVRYFLANFYLPPNDSPSKTMKDAFYFI